MRPDSELIRESACACAKLFVDEENVHMAQIKSWKNKNIDEFYITYTCGSSCWPICYCILILYTIFLAEYCFVYSHYGFLYWSL
jgi:hypothetical protein